MGSVDSSTGNYIGHLATQHGITENQKFVEFLIKDHQPISIRNDEGLKDFIAEFDPSYRFPSEKYFRQLLSEIYEHTKLSLLNIFEKNIILCSLTCDLWTGCNRLGYLGITCSYIDNSFQLQENILSIRYFPYLHTGEIISKTLNSIINEWNLDNKLRQVDYKDNEDVFNDTILNKDQADNIESVNFQQFNVPQNCVNFEERVKTALYNAMNYYWQMPSEEGMLAALLDPRCKILNFTSESLKARTYDSLCEIYKQYQNQTNILPIKQPLQSTSKLLASMYRSRYTLLGKELTGYDH
ncbi:23212_t:CDS:2 [Cetraspora pellucida]|uniref:23212_t:CDS:1 n=1 Tax=Cetraspora pellucida TaxID=1433469 RepID=A0A9N9JHS1_9GLOM|nr:23212_t:CDS:2 [Cetraspora pellucida]